MQKEKEKEMPHYEVRDPDGGLVDSFSVTKYELPSAEGVFEWIIVFTFTLAWWIFVLCLKLIWKFVLPIVWVSIKNLWGFGVFAAGASFYVKQTDLELAAYMLWGGAAFAFLVIFLRTLYYLGHKDSLS